MCCVVGRREEGREERRVDGGRGEKKGGPKRDERVREGVVFLNPTLNKVPVKCTLIEDFSEWPACSLIDMGTLGLKP